MATYNNSRKTYYVIRNGKIVRYEGNGVNSEFDAIDGIFKGISEREKEINGEKVKFIDFNFVDGEENFSVSCQKNSGPCMNILRCLINVEDFSQKVMIEVWATAKDGKNFTNTSVKQNGQRIPWVDIPKPMEYKLPTGEIVKSYKERDDFLQDIVNKLNAMVGAAGSAGATVHVREGGLPSEDSGAHAGGMNPYPNYPPVEVPGDVPVAEPYVPNAGA